MKFLVADVTANPGETVSDRKQPRFVQFLQHLFGGGDKLKPAQPAPLAERRPGPGGPPGRTASHTRPGANRPPRKRSGRATSQRSKSLRATSLRRKSLRREISPQRRLPPSQRLGPSLKAPLLPRRPKSREKFPPTNGLRATDTRRVLRRRPVLIWRGNGDQETQDKHEECQCQNSHGEPSAFARAAGRRFTT